MNNIYYKYVSHFLFILFYQPDEDIKYNCEMLLLLFDHGDIKGQESNTLFNEIAT